LHELHEVKPGNPAENKDQNVQECNATKA